MWKLHLFWHSYFLNKWWYNKWGPNYVFIIENILTTINLDALNKSNLNGSNNKKKSGILNSFYKHLPINSFTHSQGLTAFNWISHSYKSIHTCIKKFTGSGPNFFGSYFSLHFSVTYFLLPVQKPFSCLLLLFWFSVLFWISPGFWLI